MSIRLPFDALCERYDSEEACIRELFRIRWPNGFCCPVCSHGSASITRTRRLPLFECKRCRRQTSLTAGTVMDRSRTPLRKWFIAMHMIAGGATARQIAETIRVTYKTGWLIAHKIRQAIHLAESDTPLEGDVRIHQDRFGRPAFASDLRRDDRLPPILAAASIADDGSLLRIKLHRVTGKLASGGWVAKEAYGEFVRRHVAPQAKPLIAIGIFNGSRHRLLFQWCRSAVREMTRTYFGIGLKHLQSYLDQHAYLYQLSLDIETGLRALRRHCAAHPAITYSQLVRKNAA